MVTEAFSIFQREFESDAEKLLEAATPEVVKATHDVSGERRASNGEWTAGGSAGRKTGAGQDAISNVQISTEGLDDPAVVSTIKRFFGPKKSPKDIAGIYTYGVQETFPKGSSLHLKMSSEVVDGQTHLTVEGRIPADKSVNVEARDILYFSRVFRKTNAGRLSVEHHYLRVDPKYQGTGFGSEFYYHSEDAYKKLGVSTITTEADLDVGAYAWARMGFEFDGESERKKVLSQFENTLDVEMMDRIDAGQDLEKAEKAVMDQVKKFKYPYQFAAFKVKIDDEELAIGKMALATSGWDGYMTIKHLDQETPAVGAGELYKKLQKSKKRVH